MTGARVRVPRRSWMVSVVPCVGATFARLLLSPVLTIPQRGTT
jgi:hypothetical protein